MYYAPPGAIPGDKTVQSTSMQRHVYAALAVSAFGIVSAAADPMSLQPDRYTQANARPTAPAYIAPIPSEPVGAPAQRYAAASSDVSLGGGFIEFLFRGGRTAAPPRPPSEMLTRVEPAGNDPEIAADPSRQIDPRFLKQVVDYHGSEPPGTIIIDTPQRFLLLVQENGKALRYGIGVGKPGFTWAGEKKISAKKEWPDWTPPPEMLERRPDLPHFMAGGPENPLGARAMYLGSSLYRIHGSNEPWTIGQAVSSGCIRMRNEDVIDLYERVRVGTKVVVI
jgi:lipoprotein-anchoring transpeptidase ErfK/SrfK